MLLDGKKLAGVLTELGFGGPGEPAGDSPAWAVVGIGLNVNVDFGAQAVRREWPDLADTAISLSMALGRPLARLPLLHQYLLEVERRYQALKAGQTPHDEWASRLATLGNRMIASTPEGTYRGMAEGVDETGALLLRKPDGERVRILAGDVGLVGT